MLTVYVVVFLVFYICGFGPPSQLCEEEIVIIITIIIIRCCSGSQQVGRAGNRVQAVSPKAHSLMHRAMVPVEQQVSFNFCKNGMMMTILQGSGRIK